MTVVATALWLPARAGSPVPSEIDHPRSDFHWRLPADWEFAEPGKKAQGVLAAGVADIVVARAKGPHGPVATLVVLESVSYQEQGNSMSPADAEQFGRMTLRRAGVSDVSVESVSISGRQATRVSGTVRKPVRRFVSVAVLSVGPRRFEVQCVGDPLPPDKGDPCDPAIAGLTLRRRAIVPDEEPRHLRLRGEAFGITFDPPDDRWLGIGPRLGAGGTQKLWVWMLDGRQIDVQGLDVSKVAAYPDARGLAELYAAKVEREGGTAKIGIEEHRGLTWTHLAATRGQDGHQEDMFIRRVEKMVYTIHILQPTRDPLLVRQALAGFSVMPLPKQEQEHGDGGGRHD